MSGTQQRIPADLLRRAIGKLSRGGQRFLHWQGFLTLASTHAGKQEGSTGLTVHRGKFGELVWRGRLASSDNVYHLPAPHGQSVTDEGPVAAPVDLESMHGE